MAKKDNIIDFRDYQPGKRETIETHDLDAFRATLYDLGFLGSSSSDTPDESKEVESETDDESKEDFEKPPFVVSKKFPKIKSTFFGNLKTVSEEADDEKIDYEESSLSDLIIKATKEEEKKCGFKNFDSDESAVEDDDSDDEVVSEADFKEVDSEPEKKPSDFEEEPHTSKTRTSSFGNFFKKFEKTNFAERILSNFGLGETPSVQPSKAAEEKSKTEDSTSPQFNSRAQELLSKEIMEGKIDRLKEWSKNDNVNKLMFLFSGNSVLSDWIMENEPDIFWDLPDEVIDVILEKNKKSSEKKDDKKKS